jgi:hypothetical protein
MTFIIFILIIVLILLYAVSQVIPIGGILAFAVTVGLSLALDVRPRGRQRRNEGSEE